MCDPIGVYENACEGGPGTQLPSCCRYQGACISVLGDPGVCLDVCFAKMLGPLQKVFKDTCGPTELCLPCLIGAGQGVPGR